MYIQKCLAITLIISNSKFKLYNFFNHTAIECKGHPYIVDLDDDSKNYIFKRNHRLQYT